MKIKNRLTNKTELNELRLNNLKHQVDELDKYIHNQQVGEFKIADSIVEIKKYNSSLKNRFIELTIRKDAGETCCIMLRLHEAALLLVYLQNALK